MKLFFVTNCYNRSFLYKDCNTLYNWPMYSQNSKVFIEDDDLCITCENYLKEMDCPLLAALALGDVYIENSLQVTNCGFYKEFKRNLRIVKDDE